VGHLNAQEQQLMLTEAYEKVERHNAEIKAYRSALQGAAGGVRHARLPINPELEIELEDFGRDVIEVVLSQEIELGDKRGSRIRVAQARQTAAEIDLESAVLRIRSEVMSRFTSVIEAHRKVELVDSLLSLARTTTIFVERQVDAGAAKAIDLVRAETAIQEIELEKRALENEYMRARRELAVLWGDPADVEWVPRQSFKCAPLEISLEEIRSSVERHPELRLVRNHINVIGEERSIERSAALPEISLDAGFIRDNAARETIALIGASISLPIFNRHQGAIAQKDFEIQKVEYLLQKTTNDRWLEVHRLLSEIGELSERLEIQENVILPNSSEILLVLTEHYRNGAISILEVLDAQQFLMEKWIQYTEDLSQRAQLASELFAFTGIECEVVQ
jgi:cobalt-zinc-cadmium efflux system outer membrane protein